MIQIADLLGNSGVDDQALSSIHEIEDVLLLLAEINRKIDYFKALKKYRTQSIDEKVSNLALKAESIRKVILNTMNQEAPNDKTLDFPSIGKVSRRKTPDSWSVKDEEALVSFLGDEGVKEEIVRTVETIDKRKLNKLISEYDKSGKSVPGSERVPGKESLSVTLEESALETSRSSSVEAPALDMDALDALIV
jgi:phage host-nuclease inhibitor protein Gam